MIEDDSGVGLKEGKLYFKLPDGSYESVGKITNIELGEIEYAEDQQYIDPGIKNFSAEFSVNIDGFPE